MHVLPYGVIVTCSTSEGGTRVYTDIMDNTVWTKEDSPYIVMEPITIRQNVTQTIEPGVAVVFKNEIRLTIEGSMVARGSEGEGVVFKPLDDKRKPHIRLSLVRGKFILEHVDFI